MAILKELTAYSKAVMDGKVIACQKHKWAARRFLDDLARRKDKGWAWDYDEAAAERYFAWMRLMKHRMGELAMQRKEPCDYELFVYGNIYGWWNKTGKGERRFRQMYEQLARKQAKSQNKAIQALYEISCMNEPSAVAFVAATKKQQTMYVYSEAEWLINNCAELSTKFTCKHSDAYQTKVITHIKSGSVLSRLSKDDKKTGDGSNPHFAVLDEYHLHETTEYYDLMKSGMVLRKNPLLSIITTAGFDLSRPCFRVEYDLVSKILNPDSPVTDDRYFVMVCELDRNETQETITTEDGRTIEPGGVIDELGSETAIMKACPVTGYTETLRKSIAEHTKRAEHSPEEKRNLLTKTYNVWIQSKPQGYMDMTRWGACRVETAELMRMIDEKAGGVCYVGFDLSKTIDLTAVGFVFPWSEDGVMNYAVISHAFIPEDRFAERMRTDKMPYDVWRKDGYLSVTDGAVVDYRRVMRYALDTIEDYEWDAREFCLDPYAATALANDLQEEGKTVLEIRQGVKTLSEPTKSFREAVFARRLWHDGNPLLSWAIGNAVTRQDHNDNIMLDKERSAQRIDPIAAIITAFVRGMVHSDAPKGEYGEGYSYGAMFV